MHLKVHFKIYIKVHKKVHLLMQLSMHKSVQYDSVKGEIDEALYAALEGASKISF